MSRCWKSSLGSCCRLLFESDLEKERCDSGEFLKTAGRLKKGVGGVETLVYVQVRQGFESPEGELGKSLNVVVFDEPVEEKIHLSRI